MQSSSLDAGEQFKDEHFDRFPLGFRTTTKVLGQFGVLPEHCGIADLDVADGDPEVGILREEKFAQLTHPGGKEYLP